jgi:aldose 1-epimerase
MMPRFTIAQITRGGFAVEQLRNETTGEQVEIIPALGGMVHRLALGKTVPHDLLASDTDQELRANPLFRGRMLFPFSDRIPRARYIYENRIFHLTANCAEEPSAIHGLVYDQAFSILNRGPDSRGCVLVLEYRIRPERFPGYPFAITLKIEYILTSAGFELKFEIFNHGTAAAPLALGWHPYFSFDGSLDEVTLRNDSRDYVEVGQDLIPTLNLLKTEGSAFDFSKAALVANREIDITLACPENGRTILAGKGRKIALFQDPIFFKYTQIYVPKNHGSISLEPLSAATNAFNFHGLGLKVLPPGRSLQAIVRVQVEKGYY